MTAESISFGGIPVPGYGTLGDVAPSGNMSGYVQSQGGGQYSVDTGAISTAFDAKSQTFGDALQTGLTAGLEVGTIVDLAVGGVVLADQVGVAAAASTVAAAAAGNAAAAGTLLGAGAGAAGLGLAVTLAPLVALAAWPAQAGPGCCGTAQLTPDQARAMLSFGSVVGARPTDAQVAQLVNFGTCSDLGQFNDWSRQAWYLGDNPPYWTTINGSAEDFLDQTVRKVFQQTSTCWSVSPPLGPVLARAVQAWNNTHFPASTRRISRAVNNTVSYTFGGRTTQNPGQPQSTEPISVALNEMALSSGLPAGSTLGVTVNEGPLLSKARPTQAANRGKVIATLALGGAAAGLYYYASRHGITLRQALVRIFR